MRKKIVILTLIIVLLLLVIGIGFTIYKNNELKDNKTIVDKEKSTKDKTEKDEKFEIVEDNSESEESGEIKEEKNNDSVTTKEQTDTPKEEIKNTNEVITNPSNNQTYKEDNPSNNTKQEVNVPQDNKVETPKPVEKKPWDDLGISEYDYYNKPAHSWAEVDFSVKNYGTQVLTLKACQDYGNSYIAEHSGGYWCNSVNSYSGDYLGEDFDYYN